MEFDHVRPIDNKVKCKQIAPVMYNVRAVND